MQFFRDDARATRVYWYFVDGAPPLPFPTAFNSANWLTDKLGLEGLGEVFAAARPYRKGARVGNALTDHPCGTAGQFVNGDSRPFVPPPPVNAYKTPLCCARPPDILKPANVDILDECTLYWLVICQRCLYVNDLALLTRSVRDVCPPDTAVTMVANDGSTIPGSAVARLLTGGICFISGTTNEAQWCDLILLSALVSAAPAAGQVLSTFATAAATIDARISAIIPDNEPVLLVGHSMGAATSWILLAWWNATGRHPGSMLVGFNGPKPGDATFAAAALAGGNAHNRITSRGDAIQALPPDTGLLPYALPPPLAGFAARYNACVQVGSNFTLNLDGTFTAGEAPVNYALILVNLKDAARNLPLSFVTAHLLRDVGYRLRQVCSIAPPWQMTGWNNFGDLYDVETTLNLTVLIEGNVGAKGQPDATAGPGTFGKAQGKGQPHATAGPGTIGKAQGKGQPHATAGPGTVGKAQGKGQPHATAGPGTVGKAQGKGQPDATAGEGGKGDVGGKGEADLGTPKK